MIQLTIATNDGKRPLNNTILLNITASQKMVYSTKVEMTYDHLIVYTYDTWYYNWLDFYEKLL